MKKDKYFIDYIEMIANRYANLLVNTDPIISHFKDELNERFLVIIARYEETTRVYGLMKLLNLRTSNKQSYMIILNATYFKTIDKDHLQYEILRTVAHEIFHMCQHLYIWRLYDYKESKLEALRLVNRFHKKSNKSKTKREIAPRMFEVGLLNDYNSFIDYMHESLDLLDDELKE